MRRVQWASWVFLSASVAWAAPPGRAIVSHGPFTASPATDGTTAALEAIRAAAPPARAATLTHSGTSRDVGGRRAVRFQQLHEGVPVVFRGAGALLDAQGRPVLTIDRTEPELPGVTPRVSRRAVRALSESAARLPVKESDATLAIYPLASGARLSWVVVPSERLPGVPYVPVLVFDALSGELLIRYNAVRFATGRVYPANPVSTPTLVDLPLDLPPGATKLESERVKALNCIDTKQTKQINFGVTLTVHVCELQQVAAPTSGEDFLYDPPAAALTPEDEFSEVQIFHHTSRAYSFFESLGMTDLSTKPLPAVANLMMPDGFQTQDFAKMADPNLPFVPFSNAFFAPANPIFSTVFGLPGAAMWFGQGPKADFAYDGDVVYHEFGHAVVDHTLKLVGTYFADEQGLVGSPGAMNEGLADYFSSAITGDSKVGEYASTDLAPGMTAIRDIDNDETCPKNLSGEVHVDSKFWTAALWKTRQALPETDRPAFDKALFDVMAAAPGGDLSYEGLSELFVASVKSALSQTVADALETELTARGVLPTCRRILEFGGTPLSSVDPLLAGTFQAPGTQSMNAGPAPYAPGVLQFEVPLTGSAEQLTVGFQVIPGGDTSSIFGGGTPFKPEVLVRFGEEPIQFGYQPFEAKADVTVPAEVTNNQGSATVDVPLGATRAFVMIVNSGQSAGRYRAVKFDQSGEAVDPDAGADGGADAGVPPSSTKPKDDDGCGCRTAGGDAPRTSLWTLLAGVALLLGRRPRRRARSAQWKW